MIASRDDPAPKTIALHAPPKPEAAPLPEPAKGPTHVPIAECAALTARMARSQGDKAAILERARRGASDYEAAEVLWLAQIREEQRRGKNTLRRAYDEAFIEALEADRGPIEAADYAALLVAASVLPRFVVLRGLS